ncbi:DoxX family protein [Variovorax sp. PBL-E5]|uniref:DoxX family protein n=1 Tax=Variovorax sp. PBL-E5 TaxID=434014 RepID=UPI00131618AA|nr:DoxX family protein [Variovorax sp. PBL-E5]VTU26622.1 Inner membrane protein YphA [Variovorax sp. PBL-E5]
MATTTASNYAAPATATSPQDTLALIGRILIAYLFIPAGISKLLGFAGTVGYIASVGLPLPQLGAVIAIIVELGFGIALLLGYKTRWTAFVMALFVLATALFFHNFWAMPEAKYAMMKLNFDKNMAIAGGLLAFSVLGAGRFGIDKR